MGVDFVSARGRLYIEIDRPPDRMDDESTGGVRGILCGRVFPLLDDRMIDQHQPSPEVPDIIIAALSVADGQTDFQP